MVLEGLLEREAAGELFLLAPLEVAEKVGAGSPSRVLVVDDTTKPKQLRTLAPSPVPRRIVRAHPLALPFAEGACGALVAVDTLSRWASPGEALEGFSRVLRNGALLVVVERLAEGLTGRALLRIARPTRHVVAPESLTGLLLNAGFSRVGQLWPEGNPRAYITYGRRHATASAPGSGATPGSAGPPGAA
jgi:hypothetical protein